MAKALKKNPGSLRLGPAEIEAAELLGKPVEHLVARTGKPARSRKRLLQTGEEIELNAIGAPAAQIFDDQSERARRLFGADGPGTGEERIEIDGVTHVSGGDQDQADTTRPAHLSLSEDAVEALTDAFPTMRFELVEVSGPMRVAIVEFLRAAPSDATAQQLLSMAEALS